MGGWGAWLKNGLGSDSRLEIGQCSRLENGKGSNF